MSCLLSAYAKPFRSVFRKVHDKVYRKAPWARAALLWRCAVLLPMLLAAGCTFAEETSPPQPMTPQAATTAPSPLAGHSMTPTSSPGPTPASTSTPEPLTLQDPLTVGLDGQLPEEIFNPLVSKLNSIERVDTTDGSVPLTVLDEEESAQTVIEPVVWRMAEERLLERTYVVVAPFHTVQDGISLEDLQMRWQGLADGPLLASPTTADFLRPLLGDNRGVQEVAGNLLAEMENTPNALAIVPFSRLTPRYKVLAVDGVNVLSDDFDPATYPLMLALHVRGVGAEVLAQRLAGVVQPATDREPDQFTHLIMTGVTAISRGTAAAIERNYPTYPAAVISDTLAAADITHVSNEVPFLEDCEVRDTPNNLVLCSHTSYWAVLEAIGADIVGLSGNHVNDFGLDGARESLEFYAENDIPIYGSGLDVEEACAPLRWEHNGNTFAFLAALAFWPETAFATEDEPGACYYYDNQQTILETVEQLAQEVDVVAVELQHQETYSPYPVLSQIEEFRELREAGADLVTGVQSHVPQALEPYGRPQDASNGLIAYGLGNLFFDQMWSWETRTGMILRHTIYEGELISTEILTTVIEDFSQPRWATPEERVGILESVFGATPLRPE